LAATVLVVLVAALHVYFLVLEMFLWRTPFWRRTFGTTLEAAESSAVLAANQGLYNGFLAVV
jgi:putative membrane protein